MEENKKNTECIKTEENTEVTEEATENGVNETEFISEVFKMFKPEDSDELRAEKISLSTSIYKLYQLVRSMGQDATEALKDAELKAEHAKEEAVKKATEQLQAQIINLKEELWKSKSEATIARREAEIAHEMNKSYITEIKELRTRLDARTEQLLATMGRVAKSEEELLLLDDGTED